MQTSPFHPEALRQELSRAKREKPLLYHLYEPPPPAFLLTDDGGGSGGGDEEEEDD